ncbi:MAG: hypothetical protein JSR98_02145 [Proteobacteria bacterium]|nr:hypothetical protein [Pseudomonadota bacterium]
MDQDNYMPRLMKQQLTLEEWICIENIQIFERMILRELSEDARAHLKGLLNEEHRKLRAASQTDF